MCKSEPTPTWLSDYVLSIVFGVLALLVVRPLNISFFPAWIGILLSVIYIVIILIAGTIIKQNGEGKLDCIIPTKVFGLIIFLFLFAIFVLAFANLYLDSHTIKKDDSYLPDFHTSLYFSMVTITTLGYGDYVATTEYSRSLVMFELGCTILLFFGAFPLLISRIANWKR